MPWTQKNANNHGDHAADLGWMHHVSHIWKLCIHAPLSNLPFARGLDDTRMDMHQAFDSRPRFCAIWGTTIKRPKLLNKSKQFDDMCGQGINKFCMEMTFVWKLTFVWKCAFYHRLDDRPFQCLRLPTFFQLFASVSLWSFASVGSDGVIGRLHPQICWPT